MATLVAGLCGVLIVGGLVLLIAGFHGHPESATAPSAGLGTRLAATGIGRAVRARWWQLLLAVAAGLVAATLAG